MYLVFILDTIFDRELLGILMGVIIKSHFQLYQFFDVFNRKLEVRKQ